jgi:hypothetical protein
MPANPQPQVSFTARSLAAYWKVSVNKIRKWLASGQLVGVNLATNPAGRPQWRITAASVEAFEARRTSAPTPRPARRRQKRSQQVDFYP